MTYLAIQLKWPSWLQAPNPSRIVQVVEPPQPDTHADLLEIRRAVNDLTTVSAAQNERINGQAKEIERSHELIKALQTVEAQLRGDLRQAQSQINALEQQLIEERAARAAQAELYGDMKRQLIDADSRLQRQRLDLTAQGEKIAVLENENIVKIGVIQVWQSRAELAEAEVARLKAQLNQDKRTEGERGE